MPQGKGEWNQQQMLRARELRKGMSESEQIFWRAVRGDQTGTRFRRQVPKGRLTLDFFASAIDLAVEIDGEQHDPEIDAKRDAWLASQGIEVMRIPSLDLFDTLLREAQLQRVSDRVQEKLKEGGIEPIIPFQKPPRKRKVVEEP